MRTFVKLSALSRKEWLELVPKGGAAGLVVEAPGVPGNVSLESAARLDEAVPTEAEVWAVTRAPTAELVHRLFDEVGVDRIQVHGDVPAGLEFLETHHIVPTIPIAPSEGPAIPKIPPPEAHPILELDAPGDPLTAGSSVRPDWEVCRALVDAHPGRKFVLSGGLDPADVEEALRTVRPWGIGVSAGIESAPGVKDPRRIAELLAAVERAESAGHL